MPVTLVTVVADGTDPITAPALAYLNALGVPNELVKRIQIDSPSGDVQTVTVTLMVDPAKAARAAAMVKVPLIGKTRTETPRTEPPRADPFGRARCAVCGGMIAAYGWAREPFSGAGTNTPAGPYDYTNWLHTSAADPTAEPTMRHDATPETWTIIGLRPPFADARPGSDGDTRDWPDEL